MGSVNGHEVTPKSRKLLQNLMGRFGCVKVTIMINKLKNNEDMSLLFMLKLRELCEENLEEKQGEIAQHGLRSIGDIEVKKFRKVQRNIK